MLIIQFLLIKCSLEINDDKKVEIVFQNEEHGFYNLSNPIFENSELLKVLTKDETWKIDKIDLQNYKQKAFDFIYYMLMDDKNDLNSVDELLDILYVMDFLSFDKEKGSINSRNQYERLSSILVDKILNDDKFIPNALEIIEMEVIKYQLSILLNEYGKRSNFIFELDNEIGNIYFGKKIDKTNFKYLEILHCSFDYLCSKVLEKILCWYVKSLNLSFIRLFNSVNKDSFKITNCEYIDLNSSKFMRLDESGDKSYEFKTKSIGGILKKTNGVEDLVVINNKLISTDSHIIRDYKPLRYIHLFNYKEMENFNYQDFYNLYKCPNIEEVVFYKYNLILSYNELKDIVVSNNEEKRVDINLFSCKIEQGFLEIFNYMKDCKALFIKDCDLRNLDINVIFTMKNLMILSLRGCFLKSDQLKMISNLKNLTDLNVTNNDLTNEIIVEFQKLDKLETIYIKNSGLTRESIEEHFLGRDILISDN